MPKINDAPLFVPKHQNDKYFHVVVSYDWDEDEPMSLDDKIEEIVEEYGGYIGGTGCGFGQRDLSCYFYTYIELLAVCDEMRKWQIDDIHISNAMYYDWTNDAEEGDYICVELDTQ